MRVDEVPTESGVYCLYDGDVCVYVGSSQNMRKRVGAHVPTKTFSDVGVLCLPVGRLKAEEQRLIDKLKPTLNKTKIASINSACTSAQGKKKLTLIINGEDLLLLERIQRSLLKTQGKVSATAIVRMALRKLGSEKDRML